MEGHEPESIQVPVVWAGVEETPILMANQFISQFDQDLETFILTIGQITPPPLIGTPEEVREQAQQISFVTVKTVARISLSRPRMAELQAALGANSDNLEKARRGQPGDPR